MTAVSRDQDFDRVWAMADPIPGWLTRDQGRMLWDAVRRLAASARVVEIGSHQGRSTVVLASAAGTVGALVVAVDPFIEGRLFGGQSTRARFEENLRAAGVEQDVQLVTEYSTRLRPRWDQQLDLLYVDGKHDYWTCRDDLRWAERLRPGGQVLVHDAFSSFGVTSALVVDVLLRGRLRYVRRSGSMALFDRSVPRWADRVRVVRQLPWFLRNLVVKLLLRLRLRPVARRIGHHDAADPY